MEYARLFLTADKTGRLNSLNIKIYFKNVKKNNIDHLNFHLFYQIQVWF